MDIRGPEGKGNKYFQELKEFFDEYKDHDAMLIAEDLTQKGFTYDAPVNFILSLSDLPELRKINTYADSFLMRVEDEEVLENFRIALEELAIESNFHEFFENHSDEYQTIIDSTTEGFEIDAYIAWMEDFYGYEKSNFKTILAPAMFRTGGYGSLVLDEKGEEIAYQVIRENGKGDRKPQIDVDPLYISIHEFGHSYVNPLTEENINLVQEYGLYELFIPVEEEMAKIKYGSTSTFFNEQIIRAITYIAIIDFKGQILADADKKRNIGRGFHLTEFTISQLEYYLDNRDTYESFDEFMPFLLERYYENKEKLLSDLSNQ